MTNHKQPTPQALAGNLFTPSVGPHSEETFETVLQGGRFRLERIVSKGHASPAGFWYDQPQAEWVVLLKGSAGLRFADRAEEITLREGDHLVIPAHCRHRVTWTAADRETIWLAIHYDEAESSAVGRS